MEADEYQSCGTNGHQDALIVERIHGRHWLRDSRLDAARCIACVVNAYECCVESPPSDE